MKTILFIFSFFNLSLLVDQVPPLENHTWKLEKIVTADSTLVVPSSVFFSGLFFDTFYILGNCSDIGAETIYDDSNMSFNAVFPQLNFQTCPDQQELMDIEEFFQNVFFFIDTNQMTTHEPFTYAFTTTTNKIYLDITNNEGSVATFYDDFLSSEQFLEDNISIYPNPVSDVLNIDYHGLEVEKVLVFDINGKIVYQNKDFLNQIYLGQLNAGVYIIQLDTSHGILKRKLIKR
ncbi:T9SS type A sorting domain-containing protein [Flavobacterium sp. CS20]|uniref:T9SS type A sorting domain-containing protein n=1 Tax=Flavobacterium sp. CS20 TaxID=2775246 RepID=UPI001B3A0513|nr:T9SS type A sorting domain-containing protein [Flavobacterium sp. CS20]QTY26333.1 T9SS type A sorting domain-containing protein [Flavobacterium sp. CS20]